jgi:hypothetical protein
MSKSNQLKIFSELNNLLFNYNNGYITIVDGLTFSQYQTLKKIEFYTNSQYLSGNKDELGRDKPFYNIVNYRVNVAVRATDLDVKDISLTSDNPRFSGLSYLMNKEVYEWMKESDFSLFLNNFGKTRARYGGVLIKKCIEKEGSEEELEIDVVPWKNVITDPINIAGGTIVEMHYMTPAELSKKKDVWDNVDEAMKLATKLRKNTQGGYSQSNNERIPVFEIHGEFPESYDPDVEEADATNFKRMMFIVAGIEKQILLFSEEEKENPYKYLTWEEVQGRGLGRGVVEESFEGQRWTNDAVIAENSAMSLSGKVIIITDSEKLGTNAITDLENGSVVKVEDGKTARAMPLMPNALPQFQNQVNKWDTQVQRATNTFDAVTGETLPSGTPLGSVAIQSQQASSYFDYKREEAGIFLTEVFNDWILPFLAKKMNKAHLLAAEFTPEELLMIDTDFGTYQANQQLKSKVLSGNIVSPDEYFSLAEYYKSEIGKNTKRRFIDVPKDYLKNFEPKITVNITGELQNKDAQIKSLTFLLSIVQDPTERAKIIARLTELSGTMSAIEFNSLSTAGDIKNVTPEMTSASKTADAVVPEAQQ